MDMTEEEWKKKLSPEQYAVLRKGETESPFIGKYVKFNKKGKYVCAACGNELFDSKAKFDSKSGWPSFYEAKEDAVEYRKDPSHGMERIEVLCSNCKSHLGHVFSDGPYPSGQRYCINSIALDLEGEDD